MDYASLGVTPESVGYAWAFGFGSVVVCYLFGYSIGVIKTAINKI
jgi:hypothetical protein